MLDLIIELHVHVHTAFIIYFKRESLIDNLKSMALIYNLINNIYLYVYIHYVVNQLYKLTLQSVLVRACVCVQVCR